MEELTAWALTQPPSTFLTPHTLYRYLEAHRGDLAACKAALLQTLAWRASNLQHAGFTCKPCAARPGEHCFIPLGFDATGAALIYGCPARASGSSVEETVAHAAHALEKSFAGEDGDPAPRQWVWVVDFTGFGITHALQARLGLAFGYLFREHFPERLKKIILLNPPMLFRGLLAALSAIADERTVAKLTPLVAATPAGVVEALKEHHSVHSEEARAWLLEVLCAPPVPGTLPPLPPCAAALQV